jgi:hypothetical protein
MRESMMRSKVVGLVAAAALSASVGIANTKGPVKLTDGQLDKVTAGATQTSANLAGNVTATHLQGNVSGNQLFSNSSTGADHTGIVESRNDANVVINSGAVAMTNSMGGQGILPASQNTGANAVQQQSVTLNSTFSP